MFKKNGVSFSQRRIFFFHETAVTAYFKFIALSADGSEDKVVAATLRLLQLTVRHALELQESILTGLATTPCGKWRPIIPQLFSRLVFFCGFSLHLMDLINNIKPLLSTFL